jgi:hypothetical protein
LIREVIKLKIHSKAFLIKDLKIFRFYVLKSIFTILI